MFPLANELGTASGWCATPSTSLADASPVNLTREWSIVSLLGRGWGETISIEFEHISDIPISSWCSPGIWAERFQTQYPYLYLYWYSFAAEFPFCRKRGNTCNKQTKQSCKNIKDDVIKAQGISKDSMAFWWRMSYIISTCLSDILIPAKKTIIKANNKQY